MGGNFIELAKESGEFFIFAMAELAILFVGISFLVGVINEFLPRDKVESLLSSKKGKGYFIGAVLGGLTPFCSCSTIPMMVGLLKARAGFGPTMSFLFASPLVNPVLVMLFFSLFGMKITLIYSVLALGMAIGIGFFLEQTGFARYIKQERLSTTEQACGCTSTADTPGGSPVQKPEVVIQAIPVMSMQNSMESSSQPADGGCCAVPPPMASVETETNRWRRIFDEAVKQFRSFLPYIILGVAIGSLIHGFLPADFVARVAGPENTLAVPAAALVGVPLYIRASTMVPIAASLIAKGMSLGAVMALIIGGAGASLPEVAMLKGLFKTPLLAAFLMSVFFMAVSAGIVMNLIA